MKSSMETEKRKCFVLMPFDERLREVYQEVYKPVCESSNIVPWRVDEISRPGSITKDIVEGILDADVVIADLTTRNANVYYELGIAHAVGNKTIMTAQHGTEVPFDIANYRIIFYEQSIKGSKKLVSDLDSAIKELLKVLEQTNNPVQEVFSKRSAIKVPKKILILGDLDAGSLYGRVREVLSGEAILYADQLAELDLEHIKKKYGLGQKTFSQLVRILMKYDAFKDVRKLNELILKYKLNTAKEPYGYV
ncbi:MAG: hypothetical protein WA117_19605 [Verrucomicrobiia bacterium]